MSKFHLNTSGWFLVVALAITLTFFAPYFFGLHNSFKAIDHAIGEAHTLTVDGSRRSIISRGQFTCAEPAPDTMSAFATQLASSISMSSASSNTQEDAAKAMMDIASDPKTQALFRRTQGIQAIRDGMFRLCEARMNTAVNEDFYEEQMTDLLMTLNFIVPLELCINASTKMGEIFSPPASEILEDSRSTGENDSAVLIANYMNLCLDISKEYGLTLARNASETRAQRRQVEYELKVEQAKLDAFSRRLETDSEN
ncbi:hypothetical protein [uncultured Roseobacter sp.]|uniref:hypothetical protein n=1 Tax=uncultured Roseobacter sp. TaxID=114847 RepID=UPI00261FB8D5|nr:hypothetical protein [uncultured Roseobacter sp.]